MNHSEKTGWANRSFWLRVGGTIFSTVLLAFLLAQNWQSVVDAVRRISPSVLVLTVCLMLASRFFTAVRWYVLLRSAQMPVSFKQTLSLTFVGLFASNFLPTTIGGDVVRLAGLIQLGQNRALSVASLAADRLINMAGMALASPLGLVQVLAGHPGAAAGLMAWSRRGVRFVKRIGESLSIWLKNPLALLLSFSFAALHMLCVFSVNYLLIRTFGGTLPFWRVIGLSSLAYFLGLVPISINGYGWQELTASTLLTVFGGVSIPVSTSVSVLNRILTIIASLPGAVTLPGVLASARNLESGDDHD